MTRDANPSNRQQRKATENSSLPARTDAEPWLWDALSRYPGSTAKHLAEVAGIGRSTATKVLARWADAGHITRSPADAATGPRAASTWALPTQQEQTTDERPRLRPGELRAAVADYLAHPQHHGSCYTPGQIARALGRSAGAVTNALHRLALDGVITQTSDHPRRFAAIPPIP